MGRDPRTSTSALPLAALQFVSSRRPPPGTTGPAKWLRCCGSSAGYPVGIPLPSIMLLSREHSAEVVYKQYPHAFMPARPAGREFLGSSCPLLVTRQSHVLGNYACASHVTALILVYTVMTGGRPVRYCKDYPLLPAAVVIFFRGTP